MARWMVERGAKHIVLVSRSGSATGKIQKLIEELATLGANIAVRQCDVTNSTSVQNLIHNELSGMPEIRGVVHGAMVLRVSSYACLPRNSTNVIRTSCLKK